MKIVHHIAWVILSILIPQSSSAATLTQPPTKTISNQMAHLKTRLRKQLQNIKACFEQKKCSRTLIGATVATISALLVLFAGLKFMIPHIKEQSKLAEIYEIYTYKEKKDKQKIERDKLIQQINIRRKKLETEKEILEESEPTSEKLKIIDNKLSRYNQLMKNIEQQSFKDIIPLLKEGLNILKEKTISAEEGEEIENDNNEEE